MIETIHSELTNKDIQKIQINLNSLAEQNKIGRREFRGDNIVRTVYFTPISEIIIERKGKDINEYNYTLEIKIRNNKGVLDVNFDGTKKEI